jgi:hypothetical protein
VDRPPLRVIGIYVWTIVEAITYALILTFTDIPRIPELLVRFSALPRNCFVFEMIHKPRWLCQRFVPIKHNVINSRLA